MPALQEAPGSTAAQQRSPHGTDTREPACLRKEEGLGLPALRLLHALVSLSPKPFRRRMAGAGDPCGTGAPGGAAAAACRSATAHAHRACHSARPFAPGRTARVHSTARAPQQHPQRPTDCRVEQGGKQLVAADGWHEQHARQDQQLRCASERGDESLVRAHAAAAAACMGRRQAPHSGAACSRIIAPGSSRCMLRQ